MEEGTLRGVQWWRVGYMNVLAGCLPGCRTACQTEGGRGRTPPVAARRL